MFAQGCGNEPAAEVLWAVNDEIRETGACGLPPFSIETRVV